MIDLYTWTTPNGRKVSDHARGDRAALHGASRSNLGDGAAARPSVHAPSTRTRRSPPSSTTTSPGGPLADLRVGRHPDLPRREERHASSRPTSATRAATLQWLMFQMSHVGPIIGQTGHFMNQAPEKIPYAIQRFVDESLRIVGVLDVGLAGASTSPASTRSPTWRPIPGSRPPGRRCRARCRRRSASWATCAVARPRGRTTCRTAWDARAGRGVASGLALVHRHRDRFAERGLDQIAHPDASEPVRVLDRERHALLGR